MPKASKPRTVSARSNPLVQKSANATKKPTTKKASRQETAAPTIKSSATQIDLTSKPTTTISTVADPNYLVLVHLVDTEDPPINRLLSLPPDLTFDRFHTVLQAAFGWATIHMHTFDINPIEGRGRSLVCLQSDVFDHDFYPVKTPIKKDSDYKLADIFDGERYKDKTEVMYTYDQGDSWEHQVVLLGRADPILKKAMGIPSEV
ncbi:MAG: hypothetical protein MMC33_010479 [Icmadophila ericetorum]|nr:hypothetical protein [Icmadophila ericetorum]